MEIVINIDEDTYKDIKRGKIYTSVRDVPQESVVEIANGTPLPKGHGRLKDFDRLESHDEYDGQGFTKSVYKDDIDNLPTIIEADTELEQNMCDTNPFNDSRFGG